MLDFIKTLFIIPISFSGMLLFGIALVIQFGLSKATNILEDVITIIKSYK